MKVRSICTAFLLVMGATCLHAAQPEPLSYKGVRFGASVEEFKEKLPDFKCDRHCSYRQLECYGHSAGNSQEQKDAYMARLKACNDGSSFGGIPILDGFATIRDGAFVNLHLRIDSMFMDHLLAAVENRYGKESETDNDPFITKAGAQFPNWKKTWKVGDDRLILTLRSGKVDEGEARLVSAAFLRAVAETRAKQAQQGSKDF